MGKKKETFDIAKNPLWLPPKRIPKDQHWFWTERWQQMERESQQDYESGNYYEFENVDEAIKFLNGEIEAKTVAEMEEEKDRGIR